MENEIYRTPEADLEATLIEETDDHFYVASPQKFLMLFFMTVGVYRIYWFYRHWAQHKKHMDCGRRVVLGIYCAGHVQYRG